jgi:hypothetical protein
MHKCRSAGRRLLAFSRSPRKIPLRPGAAWMGLIGRGDGEIVATPLSACEIVVMTRGK